MRKRISIFLIIAFTVTSAVEPGYASGKSLRPVAAKIAPDRNTIQPQLSIRNDAGDATTAEPADFYARKGLSVLSKIANRMFWASSVTLMFLAGGCLKKQKKKLMWWVFREMMKDELAELRPVLIVGLFIVALILATLIYKYNDQRRELERKEDKKGLKRWKQGAPWVIIIGSILSILFYIFSDDDTALAFMPGATLIVPEKTSETYFAADVEITGIDIETSTTSIEPLRSQIQKQLKSEGLVSEPFNISHETKSSSAGISASISVDFKGINGFSPATSIDCSQRVLIAITSQA